MMNIRKELAIHNAANELAALRADNERLREALSDIVHLLEALELQELSAYFVSQIDAHLNRARAGLAERGQA